MATFTYISMIVPYLPSFVAYVVGIAVAGMLFDRRRTAALLLGGGMGLQIVAALLSYASTVWLVSSAFDGGSNTGAVSSISSGIGLGASVLAMIGELALVGAVYSAVGPSLPAGPSASPRGD